jgi:hypothetical protein
MALVSEIFTFGFLPLVSADHRFGVVQVDVGAGD